MKSCLGVYLNVEGKRSRVRVKRSRVGLKSRGSEKSPKNYSAKTSNKHFVRDQKSRQAVKTWKDVV